RPFLSALQDCLQRAQIKTRHLNCFAVALETLLLQDEEGFLVRRLSLLSVRVGCINKAETKQRGRQDAQGFQFSTNVAVHFQRPPATRRHAISFSAAINAATINAATINAE